MAQPVDYEILRHYVDDFTPPTTPTKDQPDAISLPPAGGRDDERDVIYYDGTARVLGGSDTETPPVALTGSFPKTVPRAPPPTPSSFYPSSYSSSSTAISNFSLVQQQSSPSASLPPTPISIVGFSPPGSAPTTPLQSNFSSSPPQHTILSSSLPARTSYSSSPPRQTGSFSATPRPPILSSSLPRSTNFYSPTTFSPPPLPLPPTKRTSTLRKFSNSIEQLKHVLETTPEVVEDLSEDNKSDFSLEERSAGNSGTGERNVEDAAEVMPQKTIDDQDDVLQRTSVVSSAETIKASSKRVNETYTFPKRGEMVTIKQETAKMVESPAVRRRTSAEAIAAKNVTSITAREIPEVLEDEEGVESVESVDSVDSVEELARNLKYQLRAPKNIDNERLSEKSHLRRWYSSGSAALVTMTSSRNDDSIRSKYEYHKSAAPRDEAMYEYASLVDRFGFIIPEITVLFERERKFDTREARRAQKWASWVASSKFVKHSGKFGLTSYVFPSNKKFVRRLFKGIPDSWRQPVWYYLVTNGGADTEFDDSLIRRYTELLSLPSTHERQIDLDISRTLSTHVMFKTRYGAGQRSLFNVLRAFSNYDKQVGYCQGMANIASVLLMYFVEENVFIMLTKLFGRYNLQNLFIPGFPALMESFFVQERLMQNYMPRLVTHLNSIKVSSSAYATRWYITLFAGNVVPHHTLLRIWDLLMMYGFDVLYFVAVALLRYCAAELLVANFEQSVGILSRCIMITDDDRLISSVKTMYMDHGRKKLIDTLKAEHRSKTR